MGYSRQPFYEIRRNFQTFGDEGLRDVSLNTLNAWLLAYGRKCGAGGRVELLMLMF